MLVSPERSRARRRVIYRLLKRLLTGTKGDNLQALKDAQLPARDCEKNDVIPPAMR